MSEMTPRKAGRLLLKATLVMVPITLAVTFYLWDSGEPGWAILWFIFMLLVAGAWRQHITTQVKQAEYDRIKETADHTKQMKQANPAREENMSLSVSEAQRHAFHEAFDTAINNGHDGHAAARAAANIAFGPEAPHTRP